MKQMEKLGSYAYMKQDSVSHRTQVENRKRKEIRIYTHPIGSTLLPTRAGNENVFVVQLLSCV